MQRLCSFGGPLAAVGLLLLVVSTFRAQQPPQQAPPASNTSPLVQDTAGQKPNGPPPNAGAPEAFTSKEGKKGWRVTIPGNHPLATPAVADGKLFLGGGFGSHEFYALDARTGKQHWVYRTGDDGPTAAIIAGDLIAFNTESCELEIITKAGKPLWKKWLGDPLMSMPASFDGNVVMAYPDSKGGGGHKLACFDLKTGKELWKHKLAGDIITAPVIDNGNIYLTTVDGTLYCFSCSEGKLAWSERKNATSSPAVYKGKTYFSQRDVRAVKDATGKVVKQQEEVLAARGLVPGRVGYGMMGMGLGGYGFMGMGGGMMGMMGMGGMGMMGMGGAGGGMGTRVLGDTRRPADYLDAAKRATFSAQEKAYKGNDAAVGFPNAPPGAGLTLASGNLGQGTVNGVWSFQGSRPFVYKDRLYSSMGDEVKCVDPATEKVLWKHSVRDQKAKGPLVDAALTPPALVNRKMFVGTSRGQVICLNAEDGKELWRATVGEPILFQPAIAYGRVFVGTAAGKLFCIETGDDDDHGWMMWGANAAHNGRVQ